MIVLTAATGRRARRLSLLAALALAAAATGCVSYAPREVGAMSAYELCESHLYSRMNLTGETRARVSDELARRKEDCRQQVPLIEAQRDAELDDWMYINSGP